MTYDEKTVPILAEKIEQTRQRFKQAEQGASAFLTEVALTPDESEVAEKLLVNPLWERTFKNTLVTLLAEVFLTGAAQEEKGMTVEDALALASIEIYGQTKDKLTMEQRLEKSIDVLRLPAVQRAVLEIHKVSADHAAWVQAYDDEKKKMVIDLERRAPREHRPDKLEALIRRVKRRGTLGTFGPLWGETVASFRQRTSLGLNGGEILRALQEELTWTPPTLEAFVTADEATVRTQVGNRLRPYVRQDPDTVEPLVKRVLDTQKVVKDFIAWSEQNRSQRESEEAKYFGKAPIYGWEEAVLKDVVAKSGAGEAEAEARVAQPLQIDAYDGNLTYQGRAVHLMAQQTPVNELLRKTTWKKDIELAPFWSDDLPSSVAISGQALPFVEVWQRYRQALDKVASPAQVPSFISAFIEEHGRSAKGKGALLNAHRNMLDRLTRFMVRPDQGQRRNIALAVAYDLAGYRPEHIAQALGVEPKAIEDGFALVKQQGLNGYFKGISMAGDEEDIAVMDRQLRWRRTEIPPRVFAHYIFDGHDAETIAAQLGIPVAQVRSIIAEIHEMGADDYLDAVLLKSSR